MVSVSQIRGLAKSYLDGECGLQEFAELFESLYSEANVAQNQKVLDLADFIQALLGRVSGGYSSEFDLVSWLEPLVCEPPMGCFMIESSSVRSSEEPSSKWSEQQSSSLPYDLVPA